MKNECRCNCNPYCGCDCHEKWISVKDRLPEECENVLIYSLGHAITGGYLICERGHIPLGWHINDWDESDTFWNWKEVSHWMPLPEPPK